MSNEPPAQSEFLPINKMETGQQDQSAAAAENAVTDAAGNAVTAKANDGKEVSKYSGMKASNDGSGSTMVSSNEVQNYEVSRQISTRKMPSTEIRKVTVAVLLREQSMVAPSGEVQILAISDEEKAEIKELVSSALGLTPERGDTVIISSRPFMTKIVDGIAKNWYDEAWVKDLMSKSLMLLIISVVSLAVIRPLMSRLLTPSQDSLKTAFIEDNVDDLENMELGDGQSLEDLKAKLKPKKTAISAEMLDTANSYDDKVAIIRMMVSDESGRVANVFKAMMQNETDVIQ
jgi:flagellar M-ring protein FliF